MGSRRAAIGLPCNHTSNAAGIPARYGPKNGAAPNTAASTVIKLLLCEIRTFGSYRAIAERFLVVDFKCTRGEIYKVNNYILKQKTCN